MEADGRTEWHDADGVCVFDPSVCCRGVLSFVSSVPVIPNHPDMEDEG